ncbi:MAG TPA: nucleotidyltransferase family protein [Burkholderiales bacterium]|nr:nucleotidyltransferase family protein [Burkholderiales bacterium]
MRPLLPPDFWPTVCRLVTDRPWPPETPAEAAAFVEQCAWHGVLSLLFRESELTPVLEAARDAQVIRERIAAARVRAFHDTLERLCDLLADEPFVVLKGVDFMHRLYPEPHLRPLRDIDILVPRSRFQTVGRLLEDGRFARLDNQHGAELSPDHHERAFSAGAVTVDVHQAFIQESRHRIDYAAVWGRRQTVQVQGRVLSRLSDVDALAYHALSMAIDQFQARLFRYVDLWLLVGQHEGVVLEAAERAREWKSARALYGALSLACRVFAGFRTPEVETAMARVLGPGSRRFVDRWVLPTDAELRYVGAAPSRPLQLWRKACLLDSWARRISFPLHHAIAAIRSGAQR